MGAVFAELSRHLDHLEPHPPRFRTSPTPTEAITQLYANSRIARFFPDASPQDGYVNRNILQALKHFQASLKGEGLVGSIEGCMGAGKTTLVAAIAAEFPSTQIFRHNLDSERFAADNLKTQAEAGGYDTGVAAQTYHSATDLLGAIRFNPGNIVLIDEWQFANPAGLEDLIDTAYASMTRVVFASLNTDFARRPWENLQLLAPEIDLCRIVLAARCSTSGCRQSALFTTRQVPLPDGRSRPAHTQEPTVQVGEVADAYFPACASHHQVMQPEDAAYFDAGHDPEDFTLPDGASGTFWWRDRG